MDSAKTCEQLLAIDVTSKDNFKPLVTIDVGFGAKKLLASKKQRDVLVLSGIVEIFWPFSVRD